jgi:outer membrane receptor protein involved in Fe transport
VKRTAFVAFVASISGSGFCVGSAQAQDRPAVEQGQEDGEAHDEHEEEAEEIIVQGTRTRRRIQDEPIRVEVIVREEIEEKLLMRPGNIAMLVNETPGIRVQVTSPALALPISACRGWKAGTLSCSPTVSPSTAVRALRSGCSRSRRQTSGRSR